MSVIVRGAPVDGADQECSRCRRRTMPKDRWRAKSRTERKALQARGVTARGGRGLCDSCYRYAWERGELVDHERKLRPWSEVREDWEALADRSLSRNENARRLAPRLGMTYDALDRALSRHRDEVA